MADAFTLYEVGMGRLLERLGGNHPDYTDALVYQQRLQENIAQARKYGDTETRRAERAQIVDALNQLAMEALGSSFSEISAALNDSDSNSALSSTEKAVDRRSGGVYFEGEGSVQIQGDVVGGAQAKTTHETHFHGPVTGPVHTGSGDIRVGGKQVGAEATLETLLTILRQVVVTQAPSAVQSKALHWFKKRLPSLARAVVVVVLHPTVVQTIEAAGEPAVSEFQRRFGKLNQR